MKMGNAISVSISENMSIFCQTNEMEHSSTTILWIIFFFILCYQTITLASVQEDLMEKKIYIYSQVEKAFPHPYFCIFVC